MDKIIVVGVLRNDNGKDKRNQAHVIYGVQGIAPTITAACHGTALTKILEVKMKSGIDVIGSLNPDKDCQDRVRVFSRGGVAPSLRATDYKDPPKILDIVKEFEKDSNNNGKDR